jgi:hypothetical protein
MPSLPSARWVSSYLSCRSSQRGDSGMRARSASPISAGTAPRPRISRQSSVDALSGSSHKMIKATMKAPTMPTVIIHCCSMLRAPRRSRGAYSAM